MRLIDADTLMAHKFKNPISYNAFCNLVKRQATELVLCGECRHFRRFGGAILGICVKHDDEKMYEDIWFCADGEKKEVDE